MDMQLSEHFICDCVCCLQGLRSTLQRRLDRLQGHKSETVKERSSSLATANAMSHAMAVGMIIAMLMAAQADTIQ